MKERIENRLKELYVEYKHLKNIYWINETNDHLQDNRIERIKKCEILIEELEKLKWKTLKQEYLAALEKNTNDSEVEFEIICISDCEDYPPSPFKCKKGDKFKTNKYDFNNIGGRVRLIVNDVVVGFFPQSNFCKLSDYRNDKIEELLKSQ